VKLWSIFIDVLRCPPTVAERNLDLDDACSSWLPSFSLPADLSGLRHSFEDAIREGNEEAAREIGEEKSKDGGEWPKLPLFCVDASAVSETFLPCHKSIDFFRTVRVSQ
jgi:hypothetical protein